MPWTYILRCRDGSFYTGSTDRDLEARVWEHNHDDLLAAAHTRKRRPVELAYAEHFDTVAAAFRREKQLQKWNRQKKLALIEQRGDELPDLARSTRDRAPRQAQGPEAGTCHSPSTGSGTDA